MSSSASGYVDASGAPADTTTAGNSVSSASFGKQAAGELWQQLFGGIDTTPSVPFSTFVRKLTQHFNQVHKKALYPSDGYENDSAVAGGGSGDRLPSLLNACLAATSALDDGDAEPTITLANFILFLARFGGGANTYSVLQSPADAVRNLIEVPANRVAQQSSSLFGSAQVDNGNAASLAKWLHASSDIPASVDTYLTESSAAGLGTFIVRFSASRPASFAVDFLVPREVKPRKLLVERSGTGWIKQGGKTVHPTMHALVANHSSTMGKPIESKLSLKFGGGSGEAGSTPNAQAQVPSHAASPYASTGLEHAMSAVAILDSGSSGYAPPVVAAASGYAATFITPTAVQQPMAPVAALASPGSSAYSATFIAPPPTQPAAHSSVGASAYSASFADTLPPASNPELSRLNTPAVPIVLPLSHRALFYACAVGDVVSVRDHVSRCEGCTILDSHGLSMIHIACVHDQPEVLQLLKEHLPQEYWRKNVTRAITVEDAAQLSAYSWSNRYMPYWPSKQPTQDTLAICNPRSLCIEFHGQSSACLAVLEGWGVSASVLQLERAPTIPLAQPALSPVAAASAAVPIMTPQPTNSGYLAM